MKDKKQVIPFSPRPQPLKDKSQKELIQERREKRNAWVKKILRKD